MGGEVGGDDVEEGATPFMPLHRDLAASARAFAAAAAVGDARALFSLGYAAEAGSRGVARSRATARALYGAAARAGKWKTAWPATFSLVWSVGSKVFRSWAA